MGPTLYRWRKRQKTLRQISELSEQEEHVIIVHYSCESFYDRQDGRALRITSIAVRNFSSGQTTSFSIHKVAEQNGISISEIKASYDQLEKEMLDEFYGYVTEHRNYTWIHWNMRDINYGFEAIAHRYKVLGGEPVGLDETKKFDLARALIAIFGYAYVGHPRLQRLTKRNKISDIGMLGGAEEAEAFENGDYVTLHQSTLRKVDVIANILGRTIDGSIKTNARWLESHALSPRILVDVFMEYWFIKLIVFMLALAGVVLPIIL